MKYRINNIILSNLNFNNIKPYYDEEEELFVDLNYKASISIDIDSDKDKALLFSFPSLEILVLNNSDKYEYKDDEGNLLVRSEITFFVVYDIINIKNKTEDELKKKFNKIIKEEITPYMNSEINNLLLKSGFPPIHSFKKH